MKNRYHINVLTSYSFSILRNIRGTRPYLDIETTKTTIQALIHPRIHYCDSLVKGSANYQLAKLQRIQKMGCRIIYNLRRYDHITEHMQDRHWPQVPERITYNAALPMFKVLYDLGPSYLSRIINKNSHNKRLQSPAQCEDRNIKLIFCRTSQALNSSFAATGPRTWTSIPNDLKAESHITEFKKKLKTHLFERSYGNG